MAEEITILPFSVFLIKYSLDEHKRLIKNLTDPKHLNGRAYIEWFEQ